MPYVIPETMPADWVVDFAVNGDADRIADAMRDTYVRVLGDQHLDGLMGRLKAACLAAAEHARERVGKDWPDNAADHP